MVKSILTVMVVSPLFQKVENIDVGNAFRGLDRPELANMKRGFRIW
jgi:hypothetical protein